MNKTIILTFAFLIIIGELTRKTNAVKDEIFKHDEIGKLTKMDAG